MKRCRFTTRNRLEMCCGGEIPLLTRFTRFIFSPLELSLGSVTSWARSSLLDAFLDGNCATRPVGPALSSGMSPETKKEEPLEKLAGCSSGWSFKLADWEPPSNYEVGAVGAVDVLGACLRGAQHARRQQVRGRDFVWSGRNVSLRPAQLLQLSDVCELVHDGFVAFQQHDSGAQRHQAQEEARASFL